MQKYCNVLCSSGFRTKTLHSSLLSAMRAKYEVQLMFISIPAVQDNLVTVVTAVVILGADENICK